MASPRLRRLQKDHEAMQKRFSGQGPIRIVSTRGTPPEKYQIQYLVKGLQILDDGRIVERREHLVEINLSSGYPRRSPQCKMLTPIFHPNIDPAAICIGDHWAASEPLEDLVSRIGEMIVYQSYNTKSPLNGEAARWADENSERLPLDHTDFFPAELSPFEVEIQITEEEPPPKDTGRRCLNCSAGGPDVQLQEIVAGKYYCDDCIVECPRCGKPRFVGSSNCMSCEENFALQVNGLRRTMEGRDLLAALDQAEKLLVEYPEDVQLRSMKEQIQQGLSRQKTLEIDLRKALSEKRYVTFGRLIEAYSHAEIPADLTEEIAAAKKSVALAEDQILQLAQCENTESYEELARRCEEILDVCSDHSLARAKLAQYHRLHQEHRRRLEYAEGAVARLQKKLVVARIDRPQTLNNAVQAYRQVWQACQKAGGKYPQLQEIERLLMEKRAELQKKQVAIDCRLQRKRKFSNILFGSAAVCFFMGAGFFIDFFACGITESLMAGILMSVIAFMIVLLAIYTRL